MGNWNWQSVISKKETGVGKLGSGIEKTHAILDLELKLENWKAVIWKLELKNRNATGKRRLESERLEIDRLEIGILEIEK